MMEELHTIISVGGGVMNKVNLPDGTLKRFHNPKFPEQYIEMIDDVLQQKEGKKRMRTFGTGSVPSEAFMAVLKLDED